MHLFSLLLLFIVAACGFTPIYGDQAQLNQTTQMALSDIDIAVIPNREGQIVRNHLIDRTQKYGYSASPTYRLSISPIEEHSVEIGVDKDDQASRAQLRETAIMQLTNVETNEVVLRRVVNSVTSYNILAGQFTTFVTKRDAQDQALRALADNIVTELELYFTK